MFPNIPIYSKGYWKIHKNQKQFLEQLSKKYNIQNPNEWGNITAQIVNNSIYYYLFNNILIYKLLLFISNYSFRSFKMEEVVY